MSVPLNRDHSASPRPLDGTESMRFCATCGERLFVTLLGFWAHPHTFVAPIAGSEGPAGGMTFCGACSIFRGSIIHQV